MFDFITTPDFRAFDSEHLTTALPWVLMFFVIGSLESLLSAKAIDIIDPWKRKTNLDRDMVAVGAGNLASAFVGGLPMISEIVRSKANIDNGARTRFADFWHGVFLLLCVALIPTVLHRIPLAALAAMLIYTGFRLTHPMEFLRVYKIGKEQLLVFAATLIGVLATDLLIGIGIGIAVELLIHVINGVPAWALFKSNLDIETKDDNTAIIRPRYSAVFSNWILVRRQIIRLGVVERRNVVLDVSACRLVDHSVMEKLHELEGDFKDAGLQLNVSGLEAHKPLSDHDFAARKRGMRQMSRITVIAEDGLADELAAKFVEGGVSGYTSMVCHGASRATSSDVDAASNSQIRLEAVVSREVAERIVDGLRSEFVPGHRVIACVESVEVLWQDSCLAEP
jgi:MFS superfamily sulfate permease-like transporter